MRRVFILSVVCLAAGLTSGCDIKATYPTAAIPTAGVRFINAVPDTAGAFGMDLRFVDQLESNAQFRQNFRNGPASSGSGVNVVTASAGVQFKAVRAGSRQFRIFLDDTLQSVATIVMKDTTVVLEAGKNYTAVLWGRARTGQTPAMRLTFIEETVAPPGAQVAIRVINATAAPIDVRTYVNGTTLPGAATWASVGALGRSSHMLFAPAQMRFNVQPAGGGTALYADNLTLIGAAATSTAGASGRLDIEALPGTTIAGSAITYIVFPPSIVGARTPQTAAFLVNAGMSVWDMRPPYVP